MILLAFLSTIFPYTTLFRSVLQENRPDDGFVNLTTCDSGDQGDLIHPFMIKILNINHFPAGLNRILDRKSTRLNSSHVAISYAVFCLKKKKNSLFALLQIR